MKLRPYLLVSCLFIGVLVLFWVGGQAARAQAVLVFADPKPESIVKNPPAEVWLLFSEPVEPGFSHIAVLTEAGQRVDNGNLTIANEDNTALLVSLPPLGEGTYQVSWQVFSTVDGQTSSGTFPFGVGIRRLSTEAGSVSFSAQPPTLFSTGGRWLTLTGLALLIGLFAFHLAVWQPIFAAVRLDEAEEQLYLNFRWTGLKLGAIGLAALLTGSLLTFISQTGRYELWQLDHLQTWLGTRFGAMWAGRLGLTLVTGVGLVYLFSRVRAEERRSRSGWLWIAGLVASIGLALTISLVSHSAGLTSGQAGLALVADLLHALAGGVWAGGLLLLGLALRLVRRLPAKSRAWLNWGLILNFSTLAAGAVGVLLVSGGYLAWQHVGKWAALFDTAYGLSLVAKIALALPALGLAAVNLLLIKPRLKAAFDQPETDSTERSQRRFRVLAQMEAVFVFLILVVSAYLAIVQRGLDAPLLAGQPTTVVLEQAAADLQVRLSLEPALVGQNQFDVYLADAAGRPALDTSQVSLRFTSLGQALGTTTVRTKLIEPGHYQLKGGYLSLAGSWQVEVAIRRPDQAEAFAPFRLESSLSGTFQPIGQASPLERLIRFLTQNGGVISGACIILGAIGWAFLAARAAKRDWQLVPLLLPGFVAFWLGGVQLITFFRDFTPARFAANPVLPDSASISRGEALYTANCVMCHGPEGRGDGPLAANFSPPPADFTSGHTDSHPDGDVHFWIKEGIANTGMPAFGEQLSDEDVWHLVNYVRRLSAQAR